MNYEIEIGPKAQKAFHKLPKEMSIRFAKKLRQLKEYPFRHLKHFECSGYKLRIGDYRALIDVDSSKKILVVRVLDKRGRIYKR